MGWWRKCRRGEEKGTPTIPSSQCHDPMSGECRHEQYMSDLQAELSAISEVRHYYSISPPMFSALPLCVDRNYNQP